MTASRPLQICLVLLLLALAAFNLLDHITVQAVYAFDEGRHAASAAEMVHSHQFLINQYGGQPDYYNAKPPLSMWGAALGYALPVNPLLGVRLFTVLAALATGVLSYIYARRMAGWPAGLLACLVLVTVPYLLLHHGARTADPDMLFVAFICAGMLALADGRRLAVGLGFALLGLAFLTKSFHAAPFAMAAFLYTALLCWRGRLRWWDLCLLPACFLLPILPWAVARYMVDGTRFFHVMIFYDLLARTTQVIEAHYTPPTFYVDSILDQLGPALLALLIFLCNRNSLRQLREPRALLLLLWLLLPLLLYSLAKSKLYWYQYPLYPPLAILIGVSAVNAVQGGLHRVALLVAGIVLAAGIAVNEQGIFDTVSAYSLHDNPVEDSLIQLSAAGDGPVYIDPEPDFTRMQDWFSTAELMGNIELRKGGKAGFLASPDLRVVMVDWNGKISRR